MKTVLRLFNLVYIVLAAVACVALFTKPIVSINAGINLPKAEVTNLIYPSIKDQISEDDFNQAIGKSLDENGNLGFTLKLDIPATSVFKKDPTPVVESITNQINVAVDEIVTKLNPTIKELAKIIAKREGGKAIHESIAQEIAKANPDSDAAQIMEEVGIDEEYIDNFTTEVFDLLLGNEEAGIEPVETVEELMIEIVDNIEDVCGKLADAGIEGFSQDEEKLKEQVAQMTDELQVELQQALQEANLCDELGNLVNIDEAIDSFLADLLDQLLGDGEDNSEHVEQNQEGEEEKIEKRLIMRAEGSEEEEESKLNAKIREILNKKIEELNIKGILEQYWFIPLVFTGVLVLPWAIFIIITIFRSLRKSKCWTKSWVIFTFAILQVILGIGLYLATAKFMSQILGIIPLPENPAMEIIKQSTLIIETSSFIPSILYLVMIPLSIAYIILAHKVKKQYKAEKRAKKAA